MIRRRLLSLAVLELVNIPLFAFALFGVLGAPASPANLAGFGVFALLLAEGSAYWWLKLRQTAGGGRTPAGMAVFRVLRWINVALFALTGALVAVTVVEGGHWTRAAVGVALGLFAIVEHVNYFHVQLMHDTRADLGRLLRTRRPRRSHLARDLARTARRP
ncbi:hypothetical protein PWG71_21305 [Nocardiopsis sp. N85]|uniref:hypothetical protein n=1 Tax=Nocardiopsis sp. N85 TaxID=3029400 RepID=UPI00237F4833|nr:hypothetical protein [Nocardiopsis sp. N85]MDE3723937.1 hypothetical protein [Nocardiopsis sp. N85]